MTISNRLRLICIGLIGCSVYVGLEIDYRHWTWVAFLLLVPAALVTVLVLTRDRPRGAEREKTRSGNT